MGVFQALASDPRQEMVKALLKSEGRICVCEFEEFLEKDTSVIYRHVEKLEEENIVATQKDGRKLYVELKDRGRVKNLLETAEKIKNDL